MPEPVLTPDPEFKQDSALFDPQAYLHEYYGSLDEEDLQLLRFLTPFLQTLPDGLRAHEFGGGPTLSTIISLAPKAAEIHFSDFSEDNLAQVRLWLADDPRAFDWSPHVVAALREEGLPATPESVAERQALMRQRLTQVRHCDARQPLPLGEAVPPYDLVTAFSCTECSALTLDAWQKNLRHVDTLVKSGGWLVLSVVTGADYYTVGAHTYACVCLRAEDVQTLFHDLGYDPANFRFQVNGVGAGRTYTGLVFAAGQKC
jgi:hypothetical protein